MDLDPAAEDEEAERQLEDHNEAMDARQALLGVGVTHLDPVDLEDFVASRTGTATDSTSPPASTTASAGGGSRKRSKVWNNFDELTNLVNGKRVRYVARCKFCHETLSARSSSGTGHLLRHNCSAKKAHDRSGQTQTVLKYNPDGSLQRWEYCPSVARNELCRLIARDDLPLWHGSTDAFQEYITRAHNPRFVDVSRQTTARDMIKLYNERKVNLIGTLKTDVTSVCLTSDIWAGKAKEDYLSVVAHFVNSHWEIEKRLLGLRLIDGKHSGVSIANLVATVIDDYALTDKVFAITLDNASSNNTAMKYLRPFLSGYLGVPAPVVTDDDSFTPTDDDLCTMFLHQRCSCHVINLIVKAGLQHLKAYIDDFRTAITFLNASNQRIAAYKSYCMSMAIRPRKFGVDMDVRWNSTYLMLKHLVPYKSSFSVFIKTQYPLHSDGTPLLTDDHWTIAEKVLSFLELFYESTVALSGVYYPTATLMLHHILRIARHLNSFENDRLLRAVVVPMKDKFLKYWRDIPILYAVAFILDPRAKMRGFNKLLVRLASLTGTNYCNVPIEVRSKLSKIFQLYEAKFGDTRLRANQHPTSLGSGKKKMAWDEIYGDDNYDGEFSVGRRPGSSSISTAASTSELASYLDSDTITEFDEDFNVLSWWHQHKLTYPILALLAKDVLTVPASTISSESTFSLAGRVIEERRRRLAPDMVEVLSCIKDWELADAHLQHTVEEETRELEAEHENLYLDDPEEHNQ